VPIVAGLTSATAPGGQTVETSPPITSPAPRGSGPSRMGEPATSPLASAMGLPLDGAKSTLGTRCKRLGTAAYPPIGASSPSPQPDAGPLPIGPSGRWAGARNRDKRPPRKREPTM